MDVAKQRQKVLVDIDELGSVASLEEVTCRVQTFVAVARVAHRDPLHDLAKRLVRYLNERMQMIGHPAECVDPAAESV